MRFTREALEAIDKALGEGKDEREAFEAALPFCEPMPTLQQMVANRLARRLKEQNDH